ncbi:MAG: ABC transporter ATP-binding protein [Clostridia bacterium]|nr:ABC transporter ATP-binding protein [Clostridia bacterium]
MAENLVEVRNVSKEYVMGEITVKAADKMSFSIETGEFVVILGPSGSGKSTVLNIVGGMDRPTDGEIWVEGRNIAELTNKELTLYRKKSIGFVFQFYNLMPNLTAMENVELVMQTSDDPLDAKEVLSDLGLVERLDSFPSQLSGGEQQRVALARALVKNPVLLLCDEPTGALDYQTGKSILKLLNDINKDKKKTVVIITHNAAIAAMADKVIRVRSGQVESLEINENPLPPEGIQW